MSNNLELDFGEMLRSVTSLFAESSWYSMIKNAKDALDSVVEEWINKNGKKIQNRRDELLELLKNLK